MSERRIFAHKGRFSGAEPDLMLTAEPVFELGYAFRAYKNFL